MAAALAMSSAAWSQSTARPGDPNPVMNTQVAGSDGSTTRTIKTDANGNVSIIAAGTGTGSTQVQGTAATGAAAVGNPVQMGYVDTSGNIRPLEGPAGATNSIFVGNPAGINSNVVGYSYADSNNRPLAAGLYAYDGSNAQPLRQAVGTTGILAANVEGTKTTYKLAGFVTPAATPTDIIQITGSATKTVRITKIEIRPVSTAAGIVDVLLIRRSTALSGGTCTTPTIGKMDTNNAAATAVGTVCTANPTSTGTLVANVGAEKVSIVTSGGLNPAYWEFGTRNGQSLVLRGTSDFLCINGNSDTLLTGEAWAYDIEWTEE